MLCNTNKIAWMFTLKGKEPFFAFGIAPVCKEWLLSVSRDQWDFPLDKDLHIFVTRQPPMVTF